MDEFMDEFFEWAKKVNRRHNLLKKAAAAVLGTIATIAAITALMLIILYPGIIVALALLGVVYLVSNLVYGKLS
jgi:Flp pilus assembly protein TadB